VNNIVYIYGESPLIKIVMEMLYDYKIVTLTFDQINDQNFKNHNTILFVDSGLEKKIKKYFFLQNNALVFIRGSNDRTVQQEIRNANFFYGRLGVKKFVDEVKTCFMVKKIVLNKTEIFGDKITNITLGISLLLTPLEREILIYLFENKSIKKDYLLEKIIKIKKDTETKTAESHLTRIRGKLTKIKSQILIKAKEDVFYLDY